MGVGGGALLLMAGVPRPDGGPWESQTRKTIPGGCKHASTLSSHFRLSCLATSSVVPHHQIGELSHQLTGAPVQMFHRKLSHPLSH